MFRIVIVILMYHRHNLINLINYWQANLLLHYCRRFSLFFVKSLLLK
jgi:hypothetical protein